MTRLSSSDIPISLSPISRRKLAETVAQQLSREIREKQLPPGTRIPSERELMASLGVGRSTIREAVNGLAMLGVLEIRHGQGAFVADGASGANAAFPRAIAAALARGITRDLFEARRVIEVHTARLAAERRTAADLHDLDQVLADHEQAIARGASAVEPAVRFHQLIAEAAHSDVLASFVREIGEPLTERGPVLEAMPGYCAWEIAEHRSVLEPIRAGDPQLAGERMRAHLDAALAHHERLGMP